MQHFLLRFRNILSNNCYEAKWSHLNKPFTEIINIRKMIERKIRSFALYKCRSNLIRLLQTKLNNKSL